MDCCGESCVVCCGEELVGGRMGEEDGKAVGRMFSGIKMVERLF